MKWNQIGFWSVCAALMAVCVNVFRPDLVWLIRDEVLSAEDLPLWKWLPFSSGADLAPVQLVVAVLSKLDSLEQRNVVRQTWKQLSPGAPHSKVFFLMADQPCPIDLYWRVRETHCHEWAVSVPNKLRGNVIVRPVRVVPSRVRPCPAYQGLGFLVKFPLSLVQLAISKKWATGYFARLSPALRAETNLTVEVIESATGEQLVAANFSIDHAESAIGNDDGFLYASVEEQLLLRHFEGVLRIRPADPQHPDRNGWSELSLTCNVNWNRMFGEAGVLIWTRLVSGPHGHDGPFSRQSCPLVSLVYRVDDLLELRNIIGAKPTQNKCHQNQNRNLQAKLVEEAEDHDDDDLFYPGQGVVDTESGQATTLIAFLKWLPSKWDFRHLLITSDDSFVAVNRLVSSLSAQQEVHSDDARASPRIWRSRFQHLEPVLHDGPHAETDYMSQTYPPLPSGAGSLLSRSLVDAICTDSNSLRSFAHLRATLAIWLAPLAPLYIQDAGFADSPDKCDQSSVSVGSMNRTSLLAAWSHFRTCGSICTCA